MIDLIAAILLSLIFAAVVVTLVALAPAARGARISFLSGAALWTGGVLLAYALGGFAPGAAGPVPTVIFPFGSLLVAGAAAWFLSAAFRRAVLAVPLPALVAVHIGRLFGAFFVVLYAAGRLPAPFAPVAGWGDVSIAALAIPIAALVARNALAPRWVALWNAAGAVDLAVAVSLAVLSVPGTPFRVFAGGSGSAATMGTLPWVLIPTTLVPIYLMAHWAIARKLAAVRHAAGTLRIAGGEAGAPNLG